MPEVIVETPRTIRSRSEAQNAYLRRRRARCEYCDRPRPRLMPEFDLANAHRLQLHRLRPPPSHRVSVLIAPEVRERPPLPRAERLGTPGETATPQTTYIPPPDAGRRRSRRSSPRGGRKIEGKAGRFDKGRFHSATESAIARGSHRRTNGDAIRLVN